MATAATVNEKTKAAMEKAAAMRKQTSPADVMYMKLNSPDTLQSIENALPATIKQNAKRFSRILMTLVRQTRGLAECELASVLGGALTGAALGLDPTPGLDEFYLVPFRDGRSGKKLAQFVLGYKGMQRLAYQGGCKKIIAREVCKNDVFEITYGYDEKLIHKPPMTGSRGEEVGYYVMVTLPDGEKTFCYITKEDALKHAKDKSRAHSSGPWQSDFSSMAEKTCMRKIFKWLPKSTEAAIAVNKDEGVVNISPEDVKSGDSVLEAQVSHVVDIDVDETENETRAEAQDADDFDLDGRAFAEAQEKSKDILTKDDVLHELESRMDTVLGPEGLDLTSRERERYIADTLGMEELTGDFRTAANMKRVIAAAEALIKTREA